jgi:AcrR family transcriptional regulator
MTLPLPSSSRNDRRQRIVLVASQMFAERAYVEVQMDELAKAAEVAKPTIYRYFNSKEDLFLEALDGTMNELVAEVSRVADESAPAPAVLRQVIAAAPQVLCAMHRRDPRPRRQRCGSGRARACDDAAPRPADPRGVRPRITARDRRAGLPQLRSRPRQRAIWARCA